MAYTQIKGEFKNVWSSVYLAVIGVLMLFIPAAVPSTLTPYQQDWLHILLVLVIGLQVAHIVEALDHNANVRSLINAGHVSVKINEGEKEKITVDKKIGF